MPMNLRLLPLLSVSVLLTACALQPRQLQGNFTPINQAQATLPDALGDRVRWGGQVVGVRDTGSDSCLEIQGFRLADSSLRPLEPNAAYLSTEQSRFLACTGNGFDAALAKPGVLVTVTGSVMPPQFVNVERDRCVDGGSYTRTPHARDKNNCIVALATLAVDDSFVWPFRAEMNKEIGAGGGGGGTSVQ
jgi:outer membrane lipoprotein